MQTCLFLWIMNSVATSQMSTGAFEISVRTPAPGCPLLPRMPALAHHTPTPCYARAAALRVCSKLGPPPACIMPVGRGLCELERISGVRRAPVQFNGEVIFSKIETNRLPSFDELVELLQMRVQAAGPSGETANWH